VKLIVFDMDGTLLNARSQISPFTAETLQLMTRDAIPYTIATGRTLQAALGPIRQHRFTLPHILKNGTVIWCPTREEYSHSHLLTPQEVWHVLAAFTIEDVTPFVFTLEDNGRHAVYHSPLRNPAEQKLAQLFEDERHLPLEPLNAMPENASVINVSALGPETAIKTIIERIDDEPQLVAYTGTAIQADHLCWVDIHHSLGSKGNGIAELQREHGFDEIIVFGDGDNDLSMFSIANESYAPENAHPDVLSAATEVIGHHDADGVAHFLRRRFNLRD